MVEKIKEIFSHKKSEEEIKKELDSLLGQYRKSKRDANRAKKEMEDTKGAIEKLLKEINIENYESSQGTITIFTQTKNVLNQKKLQKEYPYINIENYMKKTISYQIRITPKDI